MEQGQTKRLDQSQVLALRGLRLPSVALQSLRESGIRCEPALSIEWQKGPDLYVIRGRESGGAVAQLGAYCGFVAENGDLLEWVDRLNQVGRNGFHALVFASPLVRVHAFRNQRSYALLISRHRLRSRPGKYRPVLENAIVFHGVRGTIVSPHGDTGNPGIDPLPLFDDGFGRPVTVPEKFEVAVRLAIAGAHCIGCHHSHLLQPRK